MSCIGAWYRRGWGTSSLNSTRTKPIARPCSRNSAAAGDRSSSGGDTEWIRVTDSLRVSRDRLNAYVQALHAPGSQGFSVFEAITRVANGGDDSLEVSYSSKDAHDKESYRRLVTLAGETARIHRIAANGPALALVEVDEWSYQWEREFLSHTRALQVSLAKLRETEAALSAALGLRADGNLGVKRRTTLKRLAPRASQEALDITTVPDLPPTQLTALTKTLAKDVQAFYEAKSESEATYKLKTVLRMPLAELDDDWRKAQAKIWPASFFARRKAKKRLQTYVDEGNANPTVDLNALISLKERHTAIQDNPLMAIAGEAEAWDVEHTAETTKQAITFRATVDALQQDVEDSAEHSSAVADLSTCADVPVRDALKRFLAAEAAALKDEAAFARSGGKLPPDATATQIEDGLATVVSERARLADWAMWTATRDRAMSNGLGPLIAALEDGRVDGSAEQAFERAYAAWWLPWAMDASDELRRFRYWDHEDAVETFCRLDDEARSLTPREVLRRVAHDLPGKDGVRRKSELGVLRHQLNLKRPSMPIRRLLESLPESFGKLAPCVLMSPLSVAQYLPAGRAAFDVVVFDEASQITTWDAIGAIARGQQTIVVGDPKQLPPTNFFGRADDQDEDLPDIERDMPSILEEVAAAGVPERRLDWHYRSRDEALIAFSNRFYYDGRLVTFPAPTTGSGALRFHKVDGVYVRGQGGRVNHREGEAVAEMVRQRLTSWLQLPTEDRLTLGVITFNSEQQSLILDLLDSMRRDNADLEWFFSQDREEPVIVKNLENIQGDERDVMLFSVTFGPDVQGKLTMNFGPLNNSGGERRLNVAVTRARREMHVFSSILAEQIDLGRTRAVGVKDLKTFLDYAERGPIALPAADQGSVGPVESPFEESVARALESRGWEVRTQVGVSGFRIDLGIVHPDRAGSYLCGIECDGARYHSSATARDRDKIRQAVLEGLGWSIIRIWSTDWFRNAATVNDRVHDELEQLLEADRKQPAAKDVRGPAEVPTGGDDVAGEAEPQANRDHHDTNETPRAQQPSQAGNPSHEPTAIQSASRAVAGQFAQVGDAGARRCA